MKIFNQPVNYEHEPKSAILSGITGRLTSLIINCFFQVYDFLLKSVPSLTVNKNDTDGIFIMLLCTQNIGDIPYAERQAIRDIFHMLPHKYTPAYMRDLKDTARLNYEITKQKPFFKERGNIVYLDEALGKEVASDYMMFQPWEYRPWYINEDNSMITDPSAYIRKLDDINTLINS